MESTNTPAGSAFDRMRSDRQSREAAEFQRRLEAARAGQLGDVARDAVQRVDALRERVAIRRSFDAPTMWGEGETA